MNNLESLLNGLDTTQKISNNPVGDLNSIYNTAQGIGIWGIISLVLAIVGGILVYFLFVNKKTKVQGKFLNWLKSFLSFDIFWIEAILKITYYVITIFVVLSSFSFLALGGAGFVMFLFSLILGPIFVRLVYEAGIMFVMIWRNTRDIAENTKKK